MANESSRSRTEVLSGQYRALLEVAESIATHRDLHELFRELAQRLPRVVEVNFVSLSLHDPARNIMKLHTLQANVPAEIVGGHEEPVEETPAGLVWLTQQPVLVPDLAEEPRWPTVTGRMEEDGIRSFCVVPLTTALRRLGAMGFASQRTGAYSEADVEFLRQIGRQVAVAADNVLHQQELAHDRDRLRLLLEVSESIASHRELPGLFRDLAQRLHRLAHYDGIALVLHDPVKNLMRTHIIEAPRLVGIVPGLELTPEEGPAGLVWKTQQPLLIPSLARETRFPKLTPALRENGLQSICAVPLTTAMKRLGAMVFGSMRESAYEDADLEFLSQVAKQVAVAVENAQAYQEIAALKDRLAKEKLYLEGEIQSDYNFEEIVGDSPRLKAVLKQVEIVAPTDSSVLILGETGTGKELLARAIHSHSSRGDGTFVKINCAAIPTGLLESELFGHERGAFTGAIAQKVGRFELADKGTLFLDEVGDIPPELQSKLLRVLQEQEFERLGGTRTIRVNVRVVAATNRDLGAMVAEKQFRSDLYYRLNVFPLTAPPLRDRPEDVPVLVRYFAQKYARRMNKRIETIPTETMSALSRYAWPGNIRELENMIERAVILSPGSELRVPLGELKSPLADATPALSTLEAAEREHILRALQAARWVIGGPAGAAAKLGMKRTTLQSRMQKLGIARPQ
jgi:formate hydrogenlyase transcriptional activator